MFFLKKQANVQFEIRVNTMKYYAASKMSVVKTCSHREYAYVRMEKRKQERTNQNPKGSDPYDSSDEKLHRMNENVRLVESLMACVCFQNLGGVLYDSYSFKVRR